MAAAKQLRHSVVYVLQFALARCSLEHTRSSFGQNLKKFDRTPPLCSRQHFRALYPGAAALAELDLFQRAVAFKRSLQIPDGMIQHRDTRQLLAATIVIVLCSSALCRSARSGGAQVSHRSLQQQSQGTGERSSRTHDPRPDRKVGP